MTHPKALRAGRTALVALALGLVAAPAMAQDAQQKGVRLPEVQPPLARQIQVPEAGAPELAPTAPAILSAGAAREGAEAVLMTVLRQSAQAAGALVLEGTTTLGAVDAPQTPARLRIVPTITPQDDALVLDVVIEGGAEAQSASFRAPVAAPETIMADLTAFLGAALGTAPPAADPAPVVAATPQLDVWVRSAAPPPLRPGAEIAVHYRADQDGYLSLYHFGTDGTVQRLFPGPGATDNFIRAGVVGRFPATGNLEVIGGPGREVIKAIFTLYPSSRTAPTGEGERRYRQPALRIIPTHYPVMFADEDLSRFYALPPALYAEKHVAYDIETAAQTATDARTDIEEGEK